MAKLAAWRVLRIEACRWRRSGLSARLPGEPGRSTAPLRSSAPLRFVEVKDREPFVAAFRDVEHEGAGLGETDEAEQQEQGFHGGRDQGFTPLPAPGV